MAMLKQRRTLGNAYIIAEDFASVVLGEKAGGRFIRNQAYYLYSLNCVNVRWEMFFLKQGSEVGLMAVIS